MSLFVRFPEESYRRGALLVVALAGLAGPAGAQTVRPQGARANPNLPPAGSVRPAAPARPAAAPAPVVAHNTLAPMVTTLAPTRNQRSAPRASNVAATFSEALLNNAATQGALTVFSPQRGGKVAGAATVGGSTLTFDPTTDFRAGETVSATLTTAAQSATGNLAQAQVFQFIAAVGGGSGNLSGSAATPEVALPGAGFNLAVGDVDGDVDLDLVVPNLNSPNVSIRLNSGLNSTSFVAPATGAEVSVGGNCRSVVLGDIDADGDLDLVATRNFGGINSVSIRKNNGSGLFSAPAAGAEVSVGSGPTAAALGDVDGDGDLDLLTTNDDNTVSVRLNDGSGLFAGGSTVGIGSNPLGMALGDADNDGDLDVFTTAFGSGGSGTTVSLRLNNGSGVFAAPTTGAEITVGTGPVQVAVGDVNGDGFLDLAACNFNSNNLSVRLNNGSGVFLTPTTGGTVSVGTGPEHLALADVNGDGHLDLLSANFGSSQVSVRLNNGSGVFATPAANAEVSVGSQPAGLAVGDLDGDGDVDFATGNFGSPSASVRLNQGPDLVVSTPQAVSGTYNTVTVTGTGVATLTGALTVNTGLTVQAGGQLITACQPLTGAGTFTLLAGATLNICDPAGLTASGAAGAVQVAGTRSFSSDAVYIYDGTAAQVTGAGLPAQVRSLATVNNSTVTLSGPTSASQLVTVGGAGNLALNGQALTLLSSAAGTALLVNNGAGQVNGGTGQVTGATGVMQRYIDPTSNAGPGYRHYSAPVSGSTVADLATAGFVPSMNSGYNTSPAPLAFTPFPNVYGYDQTRLGNAATGISTFDKGFFSPAGTGDALVVGRGYTVNIGAAALVDFQGTFTQGATSIGGLGRLAPIPAAGPSDQTGWHLVGNPYPAPLDWGTVTDAARPNVDAAAYVYRSTGPYVGTYVSFVNGAGAGTGLIAAGQGFFVRASSSAATGSISLTNANRRTTYAAQPAFQRTASTRPAVQLTLRDAAGTLADDVFVYAEAGATTAFDGRFDAHKLPNTTGLNVAALAAGAEALSVQGLEPLGAADVLVPLQVGVPTPGTYSLRAVQLANLPAGTRAVLLDALTGSATDLALQPGYSFAVGNAAVATTRFRLLLTQSRVLATAPAALAAQVLVYPNPARGAVSVELPAAWRPLATTLTLLNAVGQRVRTQALPAGSPATVSFPLAGVVPGLYLLQLATPQGTVLKRLVVE